MNKIFATSLGVITLSTGGLALSAGNAQAALSRFALTGNFRSGGSVSWTFDYESNGNIYSNWNFSSSPTALTGGATPPFTNPFIYNTSNSVTGTATQSSGVANTSFRAKFERYEDPQIRVLTLVTLVGLNTLTKVGDSTSLVINLINPGSQSNEFYNDLVNSNSQTLGLSGGSVVSIAVPEPLTILGAATAVGFGMVFKRRALKNGKKA